MAYAFSLRFNEVKTSVEKTGFELAKLLPSVRKQLADEKADVQKTLEAELKTKTRAMGEPLLCLPKQGQSAECILTLMKNALVTEDEIWENGKVSGCVYHGDRSHQQLLNTAYSLYSLSVNKSYAFLLSVSLLHVSCVCLCWHAYFCIQRHMNTDSDTFSYMNTDSDICDHPVHHPFTYTTKPLPFLLATPRYSVLLLSF